MTNPVTLARIITRLSEDGYDLEIHDQGDSVVLKVYSDNIQVNRYVTYDLTPRELIFVFWDISNTLKRMERKVGKVKLDRKRN